MPCRLDQLLAPHSHCRLGLLLSRNKNPTTVLGLQSNQVKLSRALEKPAGIYTWIQLFNLFAHAGIRCSTLGLHQYSTHDYIDFPIDVNESERPITGYLCLGYYEGLHSSTKEATPLLQHNSAEGDGHSRGTAQPVHRNSRIHLRPFRGFAIIITAHHDDLTTQKPLKSLPQEDAPLTSFSTNPASRIMSIIEKRFPRLSISLNNETPQLLEVHDPEYVLQSQQFLSLASKTGYFGSNKIGFRTFDKNGLSPTLTSRNTIIVDIESGHLDGF